MGVDQTSLDRIRNATFPASRRGYDKHEVEKFLARLADWLETGGGDESRSETVKRELERVGERTGAILAQAEESAQQIRSEAEQQAQETVAKATAEAEQARSEADAYSKQTRTEADGYAEQTRKTVEEEAAAERARSEEEARATIADAEGQAERIVDEGTRRREDIESVIADLVRRRDQVLADIEELGGKLSGAVSEHKPAEGEDPFDRPDQLDPSARDGDSEQGDEPFDVEAEGDLDPDAEGPVDEEPGEAEEEPAEDETGEQPAGDSGSKGKKRRSRRVRS
jgi:DivIVA domain-containing protein